MADIKVQKIKLLKIWEILNRKADKDTPISTRELISELRELGISADRRTIYADIEAMQCYGYEINKRLRGHEMVYWVENRDFDIPEIKILMDCVHSAQFVTEGKTKELVDKLADLGGSSRRDLLKRTAVRFDTVKHTNDDVYKIVDRVERAIETHKKVSFRYFLLDHTGKRVYKHNGKVYIEEPLAMVCNDGDYYLLCYHNEEKYENHIKIFRIDRISDISVLLIDISDEAINTLSKAKDYPLQAFRMYSGVLRNVTIEFEEKLIGVVFNKFGEITIIKKDCDKYTASVAVQISPTFWGWLMQFPAQIRIVEPDDVGRMFYDWIMLALNNNYEKGKII